MPEYNYIAEQIVTVTDFFTAKECDAYIELAESIGFEDAPINTALGPQFHYDGCYERGNGERSHLTFMVYLNGGFQGGETTIDRFSIAPQKGLALFFQHRLLHKGQPLIEGRKYVLRTDVMYRRPND